MVNTVYEEQKTIAKMPGNSSSQRSNQQELLVRGFLGVYAVNCVFEEAHLKFCLEYQAHDIYDVFQWFSVAVAKFLGDQRGLCLSLVCWASMLSMVSLKLAVNDPHDCEHGV